MRKALAVGMALALVTVAFVAIPMKVNAPNITQITPSKGMVGKPTIIHGSQLKGNTVTVRFGEAEARDVKSLNDKAIKVTIPVKNALDPDPLMVTVTVDGVSAGEIPFSYRIIGAEPVVKNFGPKQGKAGLPISVAVEGTDFTTPQGRKPYQVFLFGPETILGIIDDNTVTATSFTTEFWPATPGFYLIVVGFSDGSGASAEGFEAIP